MNDSQKIILESQKAGFDLIGIIPVKPSDYKEQLDKWLKKGFAGEMDWIRRGQKKRENLLKVFPQARSIIVLAVNYFVSDIPDELKNDPSRGIIARYAWFDDYHERILKNLEELVEYGSLAIKKKINSKIYVDTGPILERELAQKAGLGFTGNNTNLINYQLGSYLFLGEILLDVKLEPYTKKIIGSCGTCQRCLDNCPTKAIVDKKILDARKCISYLTIELKGEIPESFRPLMKNRIFGCDICQEVCPWNRKVKQTSFPKFRIEEDLVAPPLLELAEISENEFNKRFKNSPIKRIKRKGLLRNVAVALGNWKNKKALPVLEKLIQDPDPIIKNHAHWAKKQILL